MSAFTIYAIVLTGIYIIYYPVTIMMDLFGKKGQKKDGVEVFNTEDMDDADEYSGTVVSETDGGYHVGGGEADDAGQVVVDEPIPDPVVEPERSDVPLTPADEEQQRDQHLYETLKEEQLNPISIDYQEEYDAASYMVAMQQPLSSKTRIFRQIVEY